MIDHMSKKLRNQLKIKVPIYLSAFDGSTELQNNPFVRYKAYLIIIT